MTLRRCFLLPAAILIVAAFAGCDTLMTSTPTAGDDFASPVDGLDPDLNLVFLQGDENFAKAFSVAEGLGPIFNNISCEGCHPGDGRGTPETGFFRFSKDGDLLIDSGGPQHQDRVIAGARLIPENVPEGADRSFRIPPPVFGSGLIEAIPVATILALTDPEDADGDGISGRANWVTAAPWVPARHVGGGGGAQLGRFSRKAQVSSLLQQVTEAYNQDMGITSEFLPLENFHVQRSLTVAVGDIAPDPEISAATVLQTTMYVRLLAAPHRGKITAAVSRGDEVFAGIGCADCHVPTLTTGIHDLAQLSEQPVPLYSDLLLHDMGEELADHRPDGDATGSEWRTAPLWGLRLVARFLGGREFYLHDGRATTLHDAILAHGGEARRARDAYVALDTATRMDLHAFLKSL
ncbi:MAG: thiol oxidoreductase [bacterium]|nr:thiol oxidoreductase [bacterium]